MTCVCGGQMGETMTLFGHLWIALTISLDFSKTFDGVITFLDFPKSAVVKRCK